MNLQELQTIFQNSSLLRTLNITDDLEVGQENSLVLGIVLPVDTTDLQAKLEQRLRDFYYTHAMTTVMTEWSTDGVEMAMLEIERYRLDCSQMLVLGPRTNKSFDTWLSLPRADTAPPVIPGEYLNMAISTNPVSQFEEMWLHTNPIYCSQVQLSATDKVITVLAVFNTNADNRLRGITRLLAPDIIS